MVFVEYAVSQGPGTLIEHGVRMSALPIHPVFGFEWVDAFTGESKQVRNITPERYADFLSIHGSERAV